MKVELLRRLQAQNWLRARVLCVVCACVRASVFVCVCRTLLAFFHWGVHGHTPAQFSDEEGKGIQKEIQKKKKKKYRMEPKKGLPTIFASVCTKVNIEKLSKEGLAKAEMGQKKKKKVTGSNDLY